MINQTILYDTLDWLFPQSCVICRQELAFVSDNRMCEGCWKVVFNPQQIFFPYQQDCHVFTSGLYQDELKKTILLAKFKRHERSIDAIYCLMSKTLERMPNTFDIITSIPSNYWRSLWRGVDLPATLARELSKSTHIPFRQDLIQKTKDPDRQTTLTKTERIQNMRKVFKASDQIREKHILVVDDIVTTGSTVLSCYKALQRQKPASVTFLTAAKA